MSARPKEYLVPPYAQRHREIRECDMSLSERNRRTDDRTSFHLKKLTDDRRMNSNSRERFETFGSPRIRPLPKSTFRTDSARANNARYVDAFSRPLNQTYLEELNREPPDAVAKICQERHDDFVKVLKSCSKNNKMITVLFSILSKITKAEDGQLLHLSSILRESLFIENIAVSYLFSLSGRALDNVDTIRRAFCILRYIIEHSYTSVISFFGAFTVLFDLSKEIRASDLCTPDIMAELDEFDQIRSKVNMMRHRQKKKARTKEDKMLPPDSFRLVNISPTADELLTNRAPFLRKNKDIGSYNDLDHYLDVQFRLLREDFVAPLRESIDEYKNNIQDVHDGTRKLHDIRIYSGVEIAGTITSNEGICHILTFDASKTKRVKWEFSKRLIFGSLLCLSHDSFQTIYFATVAQRDPSDLMLGMVEVQFTCELETVRSIADKQFVMAESSTYFEAYKHNLTALQLIQVLPFSRYIVDCEDDIKPPAYLRRAEENHYDLTMLDVEYIDDTTDHEEDHIDRKVVKDPETTNAEPIKRDKTLINVDILDDSSWPSSSKLGLDESQRRALKNALTHEFSITQGPPGTGKTFIGLKMAKALLANKGIWSIGETNQTLLVVCYTNHALDQFLCGIHSFFKGDIVRIGGRSSNEEMQQHGIKTMFKYITSDVRMASAAARETADRTEKRINELKEQIYRLDREIVMTDHLTMYLGRFHKPLEAGFEQKVRNSNKRNSFNAPDQLDMIREWLGHGVLRSYSEIEVYFGDINLERKTLAQDSSTKDTKHQTSNDNTLKTISRYFEHVGCMSKDMIKCSKEQVSDMKQLTNDCPNSVAYRDIVPMNKKSKETIRKIWKLSFRKRWELYKSWVEELKHDLIETLKEYEDNFLQCCQDIKHSKRDRDIDALRQADVIGMTTTGAAKHFEVLQSIKPKIVIVEEAAEVLEGHIITSISDECEHLILIGDHKQLKPSPTVYQLAIKYKLDLSLFERMINNKVNHERLEIQHRMRPEIANIIRLIYPYLKDHEKVLNKPDIRGVSKNVYFITHQHPEEEEEDTLSHLNNHEAEFIVGLCRYLLKQEYEPSQITVLTTYKAQMFYLQKLMPKNSEFAGVNITVVDNYQGEENEIILLSLVRSNLSKKVGFLKAENRVNVALSRARNGLYVIGNLELFADASETWAKIVRLLQKAQQIGPAIPLFCRNHTDTKLCAQTIEDFENAPEGGCNLNCEARLECGHVCELKCHVYDTDHTEYRCEKKCIRVCPNDHPCYKKCFDDCGNCEIRVVKTMPECGHEQTMPCFQCPKDWKCTAPCDKKCDNNHPCIKLCHEKCGKCQIPVVKTMPKCNHEQTMPCFQDPHEWDCKCMCERMCLSKHPCQKRCYEDCSFCPVEVVKKFRHCGHTVITPCSVKKMKCKHDCEKICKNGHKCNKMCYEDCKICDVIFQRRLTKCGHNQLIPCYMEESEWKCNASCEKTCKNNHRCKKLCSDDCNCTVEMTKEIPNCGHLQPMPCNVEPSSWSCQVPCDSNLECGHKCPSLCSDTRNHNSHCMKIKSKERFMFDAKYSFRASYLLDRNRCKEDCEFILECGHKCPLKCYEPHETKCPKKITIVLDRCHHSIEIQCYRQGLTNVCFKPCDFVLECGHICNRKCYEPHTTTCEELVLKKKKCGHSHKVQCHKEIEAVVCRKPCEYKLDCGHTCRKRCSDTHTKVCKDVVGKKLNCGHAKELFCGVNIDTIECTRHCKTVLPCGHGCKNTCAEPHTLKCAELVNYDCNYGHRTIAPCHRIYTKKGKQCHHKCRKKLACGHPCSGSCFECRGGVIHKACSVCPMPDLKTHTSSQQTKEGIPCLAKCQNKCEHRVCEKLCFEPCAQDGKAQWPCEVKCNAECEHFNCKKRSVEQQKHKFCSDTYQMIESIAKNMNKSRDIKRHAEINKSHKSCGALVNAIFVEAALEQHIKGRRRNIKGVNTDIYVEIAGKLHEFEEEVKIKSQFYTKHTKLNERILSLESMLESMDHTVDLYKIYKDRLEYNRKNFRKWLHFQKQGYRDLEKEIDRLERMARTILSK